MPATALLFPGQGSQFPGMAREVCEAVPEARETVREADDVLGFALSRLMFEGPEETLTETVNAQPAIFVASIALLRSLGPVDNVRFVAGHSIGEYSAIVAAGAMTFQDGLRIVRERGRIMHEAGTDTPGGMMAVLGVDDETIEQACAQVRPLVACAANYNAPGQIIISGEDAALAAVADILKARGARRLLPLNVSAAFHSPVMAAPAELLRAAIEAVPLRDPTFPVVGNVSGEPLWTAEEIRDELVGQIAAPVRWYSSIERMIAEGVQQFIEVGPGKVLTGLMKRIDSSVVALSVCDLESIRSASAVAR